MRVSPASCMGRGYMTPCSVFVRVCVCVRVMQDVFLDWGAALGRGSKRRILIFCSLMGLH